MAGFTNGARRTIYQVLMGLQQKPLSAHSQSGHPVALEVLRIQGRWKVFKSDVNITDEGMFKFLKLAGWVKGGLHFIPRN